MSGSDSPASNAAALPASAEARAHAAGWPRSVADILPLLSVGIIAGVDGIGFAIAVAALLFTGELGQGLGLAAAAALLCSAIMAAFMAWRSQFAANIAHVQDVAVAIFAATLAATAVAMSAPPESKVATAFAILAVASLTTGSALWLTGFFRLGRFARYFPQTVLAGFLAGSGWLLIAGGVAMVTGSSISNVLPVLADADALKPLLPAAAVALLLWICTHFFSHPLTLIGTILVTFVAFHGMLVGSGTSLDDAIAYGWLPTPPSGAPLALPFPDLLHLVSWTHVWEAAPAMATAALLCVFATILNTSALELVADTDVDIDQELRSTGIANIAVSAVGAPPGYSGLAISVLAQRSGVRKRGVGLVVAIVILCGFLFTRQLVSIIPTFLNAGLIIFLGVDLIKEWVVDTYRRYGRAEWLVVLIILAIVVLYGFLEAIVAGLVIAACLFAYSYASVPVIRSSATLARLRSTVERDREQSIAIGARGAAVEAMQLQGFLFFGTADQVLTRLQTRLLNPSCPGLRVLILDFRHVTGMDSASASYFQRILAKARQSNVQLIFSNASPTVRDRVICSGLQPESVLWFPNLDQALEWAEDFLLDIPAARRDDPPFEDLFGIDGIGNGRLREIAGHLQQTAYRAGETIISSGDDANDIFFLMSGRLVVLRTGPTGTKTRIRAMLPGSIVGDIGLALGTKRTVDVLAEEDTVLLRLGREALEAMERSNPALAIAMHRLIARGLAEKVVIANRMADQLWT